jgi:hypothetical protein
LSRFIVPRLFARIFSLLKREFGLIGGSDELHCHASPAGDEWQRGFLKSHRANAQRVTAC